MKSTVEISTSPRETSRISARLPDRSVQFRWRWVVLIGVLLSLSGGLRIWRDRQFLSLAQESEKPPFPLIEFPKVLGNWQVVDGSDVPLDPEVARIAGSSDHLLRTYTNSLTGENVSVLILYGLAHSVWPHTPEVCYPSAGFRPIPSSGETIMIQTPDGKFEALFRKQQFAKSRASEGIVQEVYHSFRNADRWAPDMEDQWKSFRYHPSMFKVQVQRQIFGNANAENTTSEFMARIVQEIEEGLTRKR
jgi:hypothetical protein